jgi:hypothetical protein
LKVPDKLEHPDKMIVSIKENLNKNKVGRRNDDIIHSSNGEIDISISYKNIGRALRIMDTLIKAIKCRGHNIKIENYKTIVVVEGEEIPIRCRETLSKVIIYEK